MPPAAGAPVLFVVEYESQVPGIPTVVVVRPLVLKVFLKPFGPTDMLALFALRFRRTPGAIFLLFLNLIPINKSLLLKSL